MCQRTSIYGSEEASTKPSPFCINVLRSRLQQRPQNVNTEASSDPTTSSQLIIVTVIRNLGMMEKAKNEKGVRVFERPDLVGLLMDDMKHELEVMRIKLKRLETNNEHLRNQVYRLQQGTQNVNVEAFSDDDEYVPPSRIATYETPSLSKRRALSSRASRAARLLQELEVDLIEDEFGEEFDDELKGFSTS